MRNSRIALVKLTEDGDHCMNEGVVHRWEKRHITGDRLGKVWWVENVCKILNLIMDWELGNVGLEVFVFGVNMRNAFYMHGRKRLWVLQGKPCINSLLQMKW